jgi:hypothetical protein
MATGTSARADSHLFGTHAAEPTSEIGRAGRCSGVGRGQPVARRNRRIIDRVQTIVMAE